MEKNVIIFVNAIRPRTFQALRDHEDASGKRLVPIVLVDEKVKAAIFACNGQNNLLEPVDVVTADFSSATSVRHALTPYEGRIFAVTSQYENCIQELRQLLPYLPYVPTPTEKSLEWATEKKLMRKMLEAYDQRLVPRYIEASDSDEATLDSIEKELNYPVVIKPSGLEGSLLVSYAKNSNELRDTLKRTFVAIQESYDTWVKRQKPAVLIEEFMVGDMFTTDAYVDARGICSFTPVVGVIVGRKVGFDDFFGYRRFVPAELGDADVREAERIAAMACHAVGLRSITAHVELMKTAAGWKVIELGPRIGGYRHELYGKAYGINHIMNDILNRAGQEVGAPRYLKNYTSVFNIYAHQEGILTAVHGIDEVKALPSFVYLRQNIYIGQQATFAKNGGDVIFDLMLSHPHHKQLEQDVAIMESTLKVEVAAK